MARDYLSAAGTSVSIERLFSLGKLLLDDNRQSMKETTVQECLSLKSWLRSYKNGNFKSEVVNSVLEKITG